MAEIVVGLAASHTPQLSSGADLWDDHGERDKRSSALLGRDGEFHTYEELLEMVDPSVADQLSNEVWEAKYERTQKGIEELKRLLVEAKPDVALVIGDDQWELFQAEGVPTFALFHGDELWDEPRTGEALEKLAPGLKAAQWAAHGETRNVNKTDGKLAAHLTAALAEAEFDVFQFSEQPSTRSLGHAFTFPRYRLDLSTDIPIVPIFINTYIPPNVPSASRCFQLGQVIRKAIESWTPGVRVAVITSGGLSHFVINEELDQQVLDGLVKGDLASFGDLPRNQMRSGNSEILNWVTAAGMLEGLQASVIDYVPGYRSPAGTGTGMAFASWA
ncbi:hypothetical protein LRP67_09335 [Nocardioides sp. cx-169]|nr:hypothetical protein [Nocardioides sp. cx-169]